MSIENVLPPNFTSKYFGNNLFPDYAVPKIDKDALVKQGQFFIDAQKELAKGFVLTVEPGLYFIPHLIDQWKADNKHNEFINYDSLDRFVDFGGIRIEDNIVITEDGYRILGPHIPRTVEEIEEIMSS